MDRTEAADYLHVSPATLARWARKGVLPPPPPGGTPFAQADLERWALERGLPHGGAAAKPPERARHLLTRAIGRGTVTPSLRCATSDEVIRRLVGSVTQLTADERGELLERVLARESMASTGLGHGVALPHPSKPLTGVLAVPVVCAAYLPDPIDWNAPDGTPVHTALLLLSPSAPVHTQMLARIAHAIRDPACVEALTRQPTRAALVELVRANEEAMS